MSLPHVPDEIAKIIRIKHITRRSALVEEAVSRTLAKIMKSIVEGDVQLKQYTIGGVVIKVLSFGASERKDRKKDHSNDPWHRQMVEAFDRLEPYDQNEPHEQIQPYDKVGWGGFKREYNVLTRSVMMSINDTVFAVSCDITLDDKKAVYYVDFKVWEDEVYGHKVSAVAKAIQSEIDENRWRLYHGGPNAEKEYFKKWQFPFTPRNGFPKRYKYLFKYRPSVYKMERFD